MKPPQLRHWTYFVVCIMTPFVCLVFCNVNLVAELRRSLRMRVETTGSRTTGSRVAGGRRSVGGSDSSAANRITLTLVVIVAMYFALVIPAELMNFVREVAVSDRRYVDAYNLALAVANAFQARTDDISLTRTRSKTRKPCYRYLNDDRKMRRQK